GVTSTVPLRTPPPSPPPSSPCPYTTLSPSPLSLHRRRRQLRRKRKHRRRLQRKHRRLRQHRLGRLHQRQPRRKPLRHRNQNQNRHRPLRLRHPVAICRQRLTGQSIRPMNPAHRMSGAVTARRVMTARALRWQPLPRRVNRYLVFQVHSTRRQNSMFRWIICRPVTWCSGPITAKAPVFTTLPSILVTARLLTHETPLRVSPSLTCTTHRGACSV